MEESDVIDRYRSYQAVVIVIADVDFGMECSHAWSDL